jgi:hypothetical protein
MDERLERDLRTGLAALLDPVAGSHPRWVTSPAAGRASELSARRWRPGRLGLAWAAVLLALLLVAALASAVFVGSQPDRGVVLPVATPTASAPPSQPVAPVAGTGILATTKAGPLPPQAVCPPGSDPDRPGPADQERPSRPFAFDHRFAFDRRAGRVVLLDRGPGPATWTFDVCTNTWQRMHPDEGPSFGGAFVAYDADSDRTVALVSDESGTQGWVWIYDLAADRWTRGEAPPWAEQGSFPGAGAFLYDPVSGLMVLRDSATGEMWAYDVEADRWTRVAQGPVVPPLLRTDGMVDRQILGYDGSADLFVLHVDVGPAWTFDARAGRWSRDVEAAPTLWFAWFGSSNATAYDEEVRRALFVSAGGPAWLPGVVAYDASRRQWETLWVGSPCLDSTITYDAVNGRIVCLSSMSSETDDIWTAAPRGMVAFDAVAARWITLLEPVAPQP